MSFEHLYMSRTRTNKARPYWAQAPCHYARSTCHVCAGAWLPERQIARLNEAEAMSFADYIEAQ